MMSESSLMASRISLLIFKVCRQGLLLCLTKLIARAHAADLKPKNCSSVDDKYIDNPRRFSIITWVNRGICIRSDNNVAICYGSFVTALNNLDPIRTAEYAGAASVLALLPTIGALLGAPTSEIWRLLTVVPFGGGLAMTLSFGGAILPVRVEDYESALKSQKVNVERSDASRVQGFRQSEDAQTKTPGGLDQAKAETHEGLDQAKTETHGGLDQAKTEKLRSLNPKVRQILERMRQDESQQLAKGPLWMGLLGMLVLSVGAQAAMIVVEQGGVIPWWCVSRYWMHLWYVLVTFTAIAENWVQFPFEESWKLFVSDIPYDVNIQNGDSILPTLQNSNVKASHVLHQLASLKAGTATLRGSKQYTRPRNAILVIVSVAIQSQSPYRSFLRLLSKCASIAAFVTGTALFASVQLLGLPVAVMTLTLILAAGIFGRAISGWMVSGVDETEPLIHVIVNTTQEAHHVISQILRLDQCEETHEEKARNSQETGEKKVRKIQVELRGHVFVDQQRVGHRSRWYVNALGVLAEPFDLRKVHQASTDGEIELGLMRN